MTQLSGVIGYGPACRSTPGSWASSEPGPVLEDELHLAEEVRRHASPEQAVIDLQSDREDKEDGERDSAEVSRRLKLATIAEEEVVEKSDQEEEYRCLLRQGRQT